MIQNLGSRWIRFDLLPYPADVNVDASPPQSGKSAAGQFEKLIPRQHLPGLLTERFKQVEFRAGGRHANAVCIVKLAFCCVELPSGELEYSWPGTAGWIRLQDAAHHGANAGNQLARIEGLCHIVVGAEFQSQNAVVMFAESREHDNGQIGRAPETAANTDAAFSREHHVENDEIGLALLKPEIHLLSRAREPKHESVFRQSVTQHPRYLGVILHEQNPDGTLRGRRGI